MRCDSLTSIILATLLIAGCAGNDEYPVSSDTNEASGVSVARPKQPLRLAALQPALSDVGKDYLFLGPVTVSGAGNPQTYLWFARGSTVDRRINGAEERSFRSIVVFADDVPMTFDLIPWDQTSAASPYKLDVRTSASYGAMITTSQIRQIANAGAVEAYVTDLGDRSPRYGLVKGELKDWLAFCCGY